MSVHHVVRPQNKVRDQQKSRRRVCGQTPPKCESRPIKSQLTWLSSFHHTSLHHRILVALAHFLPPTTTTLTRVYSNGSQTCFHCRQSSRLNCLQGSCQVH